MQKGNIFYCRSYSFWHSSSRSWWTWHHSPVLVIVRVLSLTFMLVAAWLYKDFFATQDEFLNRYNEFMLELLVFFLLVFLFLYCLHILIIKLLFMSILLVLPLGQLLVDIDSIKNLSVNGTQAIKRANGYKPSRFG